MAKAYVTRTENINRIWVFDVKSIDTERVVFNDGSTRASHGGSYEQFWMTEAEAKAAVRFAKRYAKNRVDWMRDQIAMFDEDLDEDIKTEQKN